MSFQNAFNALPDNEKIIINQWCNDFSAIGLTEAGTVNNLRVEETLDDVSFGGFFSSITSGAASQNFKNTFEVFCSQYELHGREAELPDKTFLIRAIDSHSFVSSVAAISGNDPADEEDFLIPYIKKRDERMRVKDNIHFSNPDNKVCWATFFVPGEQNFKALGWDAVGIFNALGKPWLSQTPGCFYFEYPAEKLNPDIPRVPTIADAGINADFLPAGPDALFGMTRAGTSGNTLKEVVHKNRLADISTDVEYVA